MGGIWVGWVWGGCVGGCGAGWGRMGVRWVCGVFVIGYGVYGFGLGRCWCGVGIRLGVFVVDLGVLDAGFLYNICTGSKTICTYVREPLSTEILF